MQSLSIQGFSYDERQGLLPTLISAFAECGGWVLDRKTLSARTLEIRLEIQLRSALDLYASIVASGLELTRSGGTLRPIDYFTPFDQRCLEEHDQDLGSGSPLTVPGHHELIQSTKTGVVYVLAVPFSVCVVRLPLAS